MKKLLMIIAIVGLFTSCKKDEKENPQPTPALTHQIIVGQMPQVTYSNGTMKYGFTAPAGWVIDSVYLDATSSNTAMYQDYYLYDVNDETLLFDCTLNTESMYNTWIKPDSAEQGIHIYLYPPNVWNGLKVSFSKQ